MGDHALYMKGPVHWKDMGESSQTRTENGKVFYNPERVTPQQPPHFKIFGSTKKAADHRIQANPASPEQGESDKQDRGF